MSNTATIATKEVRTMFKSSCTRCNGSGNTGHRRCNGVCFRCGGNGITITEAIFNVVVVDPITAPVVTGLPLLDLSGDDWLSVLFS